MKRTQNNYFNKYSINVYFFGVISIVLQSALVGCNKLVQIPPPANSITTSQVFVDSSDAAAAISGIYSNIALKRRTEVFCNDEQTLYCGISADELIPENTSDNYGQMYLNALQFGNGLSANMWSSAYFDIYQTNACIEGLNASKSLPISVKNTFLGEAKFLRALFYFY